MNNILKEILEKINKSGYSSYIVGGFVRDLLMNRKSYDIDICTNALPSDILKIFSGKENGYGSVNFKINNYNFDITTFRKDLDYKNRRPTKVIFIESLKDDLDRRDFTINTICLDINNQFIDYLGGLKDLNKKIIKSVGNPLIKLEEDPLRILRAIRFSCVLDFQIDKELDNAIFKKNYLVKYLSSYRIKEELDKILSSKNFQKGLDLIKKYNLENVLKISFKEIVYTKDLLGMWAQINYSNVFPFTKSEKRTIIEIREILNKGFINKEIIFKYGLQKALIAGTILKIDRNILDELYKTMLIYKRHDLKITNIDIINLLSLKEVEKIKFIENNLIKKVLNNNIDNSYESLKDYLLYNKERWKLDE